MKAVIVMVSNAFIKASREKARLYFASISTSRQKINVPNIYVYIIIIIWQSKTEGSISAKCKKLKTLRPSDVLFLLFLSLSKLSGV